MHVIYFGGTRVEQTSKQNENNRMYDEKTTTTTTIRTLRQGKRGKKSNFLRDRKKRRDDNCGALIKTNTHTHTHTVRDYWDCCSQFMRSQ